MRAHRSRSLFHASSATIRVRSSSKRMLVTVPPRICWRGGRIDTFPSTSSHSGSSHSIREEGGAGGGVSGGRCTVIKKSSGVGALSASTSSFRSPASVSAGGRGRNRRAPCAGRSTSHNCHGWSEVFCFGGFRMSFSACKYPKTRVSRRRASASISSSKRTDNRSTFRVSSGVRHACMRSSTNGADPDRHSEKVRFPGKAPSGYVDAGWNVGMADQLHLRLTVIRIP